MSPVRQTACSSITSDGTATANQITKFTPPATLRIQPSTNPAATWASATPAPQPVLDVSGTPSFALTVGSSGCRHASNRYRDDLARVRFQPLDIEASLYNSSLSKAATYVWRWEAEPSGNDSSDTNATLNLLYGVTGDLVETGYRSPILGDYFCFGQTFPGAGNGR